MLQQLELILRSVWAKVLWTATTGESLLGRPTHVGRSYISLLFYILPDIYSNHLGHGTAPHPKVY